MEIRNYAPNDEAQILELFEIVFGKPMSASYWNWRFKNNPCNRFAIKLMWDGPKLVGHYAVSPVMLSVGNNAELTGLSMTTMTHPDYTGLGVFQQLAESLYADMQELGMNAVWGFPNNNSHRGFIKNLAWKNIAVLPMLTCDVALINPKTADNIRKNNTGFTSNHEQAYASFTANYHIKLKKDAAYLNWRYKENPSNQYDLWNINEGADGFVVVKQYTNSTGKKELDIVEWCVAENEKITKSVLQHLSAVYSAPEFSRYNIWLPLNDERHLSFEKTGFLNNPPLTYFGIRSFIGADLDNEKKWWVQLGDSDVY